MRVCESGFLRRSVHTALLTSIFFFSLGLASTLHAETIVPVEYLESSGYQYIDCGVHFTYGHKFTLRWSQASYTYRYSEDKGWGTGGNGTNNSLDICGGGRRNGSYIYPYLFNGNRVFSPNPLWLGMVLYDPYEDVCTVENKTTYTMTHIAGNTVYSISAVATPNTTAYDSGNNINLFSDNSSKYRYNGIKRIYRATYETVDGDVVFDLIPVTADGRPAYYNRITHQLHFNAASSGTEFVAGPPTDVYRIVDSGDVHFAAKVSVSAAGGGTVSFTNSMRSVGANRPIYFPHGVTSDFVYIAKPDAGCAFSGWSGETIGLTSAQLTNSVLTLTGSKPRVLIANFATPIASDQVPASCYVQDGLTNQWDAIENVGAGSHDANSRFWRDLKGGIDLTLSVKGEWSEAGNSLVIHSGCAARGEKPTSAYSSLEAVYKQTGDSRCLFSSGSTGNYRYLRCDAENTGYYRFYAAFKQTTPYVRQLLEPTVSKSLSLVYSGNVVSQFYENGMILPSDGSLSCTTAEQENRVTIGATSLNEAGYFWVGEVHTIRLYNRPLTEDEVRHNAIVDRCRFLSPRNVRCTKTDPATYQFACRIDYEPSDSLRGCIACAVDGKVQPTGSSIWVDEGSTLTLTPSANNGYAFSHWLGETNGTTIASNGEMTFKSFPRSVVAFFIKTGSSGTTRTLTMSDSSKVWEWSDPETWTPNGVPEEDDMVSISGSGTVVLREPTPTLAALTLQGNGANSLAKILCTNWTTKLSANKITVRSYGQFTTPITAVNDNMSNRVWLVCRDLDVQQNGQINVDGKGYGHINGRAWDGITSPYSECGGSYGGLSSYGVGAKRTHCYGSLTEPEDLGSGGYRVSQGGYGGGAVKVEAANSVKIDGSVTAKGVHSWWAWCGGSGGSVFISTKTIDGSGTVSVEIPEDWSRGDYSQGGGGRLAVHYDPTSQEEKDATCLIDFRANSCPSVYALPYSSLVTTNGYIKPIYMESSAGYPGTLYFTDGRMLTNPTRLSNGVKLSGVFYSGATLPEPLVLKGPVLFSNSTLSFGEPPEELVIDGDLTCTGTYCHNAGLELTNTNLRVKGNVVLTAAHLSMENNRVQIDGDLSMLFGTEVTQYASARSGRITVQAGDTNGTDRAYGAELYVGGNWTMEKDALVYPFAHPTVGSIPYFECQNLNFLPGAWFDAHEAGYAINLGPGGTTNYTAGAAHGGYGGAESEGSARPPIYGSTEKPVTPGSGGSKARGGGAIRIHARNRIDMNGYMLAAGYPIDGGQAHKGSSGGSIYLSCARFASTNGILSVRGGEGSAPSGYPGGGGRIAIWARAYISTNMEVYVTRGMNGTSSSKVPAEDGTLYYYKNTGAMFLIR